MTLEETEHGFRAVLPPAWSPSGCLVGTFADLPYLAQLIGLFFLLFPAGFEPAEQVIAAVVGAAVLKLGAMWLARGLDAATTIEVRLGRLVIDGGLGEQELPLHTPVKAFGLDMGRQLLRFGHGAGAHEVSTTLSPAQIERFLERLREEREEHGSPDAMPEALRALQRER